MNKLFILLSLHLIVATSLVFASLSLDTIYGQQNQTSSQSNQNMTKNDNQTKNLKIETLLNISNKAVIALEDNNDTAVAQNLEQLQNSIINETGQQVIKIPANAIISN
jgi:hypothetical protein